MSDIDYSDPIQFRNLLEKFIFEVWDNPHQAARQAGLPYQDLHTVLYGNKKKVLKHWQVNALLNTAEYEKKEDFSEARFNYWHEVLHKSLISIDTVSAWLYSENDGRNKDKALRTQAEEHNKVIKQNLTQTLPQIENIVDMVYKVGGHTWSFTVLYIIVRQTKASFNPDNIVIPPDWQIYILNSVDVFSGLRRLNIEDITAEDMLTKVRNSPSFLWRIVTHTFEKWYH